MSDDMTREDQINVAALNAAVRSYGDTQTPTYEYAILHRAARFAEFIRTGNPNC